MTLRQYNRFPIDYMKRHCKRAEGRKYVHLLASLPNLVKDSFRTEPFIKLVVVFPMAHCLRHAVNKILFFSRLCDCDTTLLCPARYYRLKFGNGIVAYIMLVSLRQVDKRT
jgi:hypothetical protein